LRHAGILPVSPRWSTARLGVAVVAVAAGTLGAAAIPAWRASTTDPMIALHRS
jgi:hypothetical protein